MSRTYHIQGTEEFGYSTINRYRYSLYTYENIVRMVHSIDGYGLVKSLKGYAAHYCYIRLQAFYTLLVVSDNIKDYVSANCIVRMLADSIAIFHLIYLEPDDDLRLLRHCLYVIDGCDANLRLFEGDKDINADALPEEEAQDLQRQIEYNIKHRQQMMRDVQEMLDNSPLKNKDKDAFDKIVKEKNWKFREFKTYKGKRENQYTWKELYNRIAPDEHAKLFEFISQYVHGLSMSNLVVDETHEIDCEGVIAEGVGLLDRISVYLLTFFKEENYQIFKGFLDPQMRDKLLSCFDEAHRPKINEWNGMVFRKLDSIVAEQRQKI